MDTEDSDTTDESSRLFKQSCKMESSSDTASAKGKHHAMLIIIVTLIFFSYCIDTLLFPFFPNVATEKGLSIAEVGVVFASFDFARFVTAPIAGSMFSTCHPKKLCAFGAIIAGAACIFFGATTSLNAQEWFLVSCICIRCVAGIGSALLNVSGTSLLMKASGYESSIIVAFVETANVVGYGFGPALGSFLYQFVGYTGMFGIFGAFLLVPLPIYLCLVPKVEENNSNPSGSFLSFFSIPGLLLMFLNWVSIKISETSRTTEITNFYYTAFETPSSTMGILFTIWSIVCGLSTVSIARFINKKYSAYIILGIYIISVPTILLLAPSPPMSYLFGHKRYFVLSATTMGVLAAFAPFFYILPFSMAQQLARLNGYQEDSLYTYGLLTGLMNSGLCLGSTLGPVLSGVIADNAGFEWSEFMAASIIALMAILHGSYLLYLKSTNQLSALLMDKETDTENKHEEHGKEITNQVAEACSKRLESCLKEPTVYTKAQQPEVDVTY